MRISVLFLLLSLLSFCQSWLFEAATCSPGNSKRAPQRKRELLKMSQIIHALGGRNLALDGIARQSSTENENTTAQNGIDGESNFTLIGGSVVLTKQELSPFWEVVLPSTSIIHSIIITGRTDCCSELLDQFVILLYSENCALVRTFYFEEASNPVRKVKNTRGVEARSVAIRLSNTASPQAITFGDASRVQEEILLDEGKKIFALGSFFSRFPPLIK